MPEVPNQSQVPARQPIFMLPGAVSALIAMMLAVQVAQSFVLDDNGQLQLAVWFGFIPLRLSHSALVPGGLIPLLWTPVTHAFLHGGWEHLLLNSAWLAIFGAPVARRYGSVRFLLVFGLTAVAGSAAFALFMTQDVQILVGASGGVAGLTGVAMRFVFQPLLTTRDENTGEIVVLGRKIASWREFFGPGRARTFTFVWLALNAAVPFFPSLFGGGFDVKIAWQAHLGGFIAGLLLASLLEWSMRRGANQSV